ncbi:MAG TPA: hypothetical protein DCO77_11590 [Nitrospiraceae bacterium]|nr:hypothetical protein [Nitrospiraceae bacterium]
MTGPQAMNNYLASGIRYAALLFGTTSLGAFLLFLFAGSLSIIEFGLRDKQLLWLDAGLCALFFIQHSWMIRTSFRRRVSAFIPPEWYSAVFAFVSGITLLAVVGLWQQSSWHIAAIGGPYRSLLRMLYFLSVAGLIWGVRSLRFFDPFGGREIVYSLRGKKPKAMPFAARGPYRLVRHPFYFFVLIMLWVSPDLTADRLLFNVLWTIWIIVGTVLEERDLVHELGNEYREYQKRVPMFLPFTS